MSQPVCIVAGVGPGNGESLTRRFADEGYKVAMLARSEGYLTELESQIDNATGFAVDITDAEAVNQTFGAIREQLGPVSVLVHNAGAFQMKPFTDVTAEELEKHWRVNTLSLLLTAQQAAADMLEAGGGSIVVIGATASLRGGAQFASLASSKAAQHILAESMARYLGPQKVHVSYVIVDGVINTPRTRQMIDKPDDFFLSPDRIADTVFHLASQDSSAWTFQVDLRPFGESW